MPRPLQHVPCLHPHMQGYHVDIKDEDAPGSATAEELTLLGW